MWVILAILTSFAAAGQNQSTSDKGNPMNCVYDGKAVHIISDKGNKLLEGRTCMCTHMRIEENVITIRQDTFKSCRKLTSVDIPLSVTMIESQAFRECTSLTTINFPSNLTEIKEGAFIGCTSLTSINIPESVKIMGGYVFKGCTNLSTINIPSNVNYINQETFFGCTSLTSIGIPSNLKEIRQDAFKGCTSLTSIDIPSNVTWIGIHAFEGCTSLTSVHIPSNMTRIGSRTFKGCTKLTSINLANVINIGEEAFDDTQIRIELDLKELPKNSLEVIQLSKCNQHIDSVTLEKLQIDQTVFAVPADPIIWCFSIETVKGIMKRGGYRQFEHPMSKQKFTIDQMSAFKKRIIDSGTFDERW